MAARARFQPRFTLTLLYLFLLFYLYMRVIAAPALFEVWRSVPPGPAQDAAADAAARAALQGRVWIAFVAALVSVALLAYANVLPGIRRPRD
jgi:hypothetical protein